MRSTRKGWERDVSGRKREQRAVRAEEGLGSVSGTGGRVRARGVVEGRGACVRMVDGECGGVWRRGESVYVCWAVCGGRGVCVCGAGPNFSKSRAAAGPRNSLSPGNTMAGLEAFSLSRKTQKTLTARNTR